jgi:uncharacterized lipoprotein
MKKTVLLFALVAMLASCASNSTESTTTNDSTQVDSTVVDTTSVPTQVDSVETAVDTSAK